MMRAKIDSKKFKKDMDNIMKYSTGFIDGIKLGKNQMLKNMGKTISVMMEEFVDANARVSPEALHHVYEWYKVGSPNARLFDIKFTVSNLGLSFISSFRQSNSLAEGASTPFYNKARMMEDGIAVTVAPVNANVLKFEVDGEEVFTPNPVTIMNPGGDYVQGGFKDVFDLFFTKYLSQSYLQSSGMKRYLENPVVYAKNMRKGKAFGRQSGLQVGYRWIMNAGVAK
jgi:hypothetical protein